MLNKVETSVSIRNMMNICKPSEIRDHMLASGRIRKEKVRRVAVPISGQVKSGRHVYVGECLEQLMLVQPPQVRNLP